MDLKDFIKTAITDITEAVSELQSELDNGAIVNPTLADKVFDDNSVTINGELHPIEHLAFDVAVTVTETTGIDGSAKVGISIFGAKVGTDSCATTENVSRLSFSVPIVLPATSVTTPMKKSFQEQRVAMHNQRVLATSSDKKSELK